MNNEGNGLKKNLIWIVMIAIIVVLIIMAVVMFKMISDNNKEEKNDKVDKKTEATAEVVEENTGVAEEESTEAIEESNDTQETTNNIAEDSKSTDLSEKKYKSLTYYVPAYFDKYVVTEETENALIYYQKASYGSLYDGHLFSIVCYSDNSYTELPNYKYIGNDGTNSYVFLYPTDVRYDMNDKAIADEYSVLSSACSNLNGYVAGDTTNSNNNNSSAQSNDYILPTSNSQYLTRADISHLTKDQLMFARNELYARHGYIFSTPKIKAYFESKSWYKPTLDSSNWTDAYFNSYEQANLALIMEAENGGSSSSTSSNDVYYYGDYVIPSSSSAYLSKSELYGMSKETLIYARNEIYARHGYIFNSQTLSSYFNSKSWYYPSIPSDQWTDAYFNEIEQANIATIIEVETELGYR